jgi:aminoglycoside/choline kinase family phosphotransferase
MTENREAQMRDFLAREGWGHAAVAPLPGDASTRRYARLRDGARQALLMDQPQGAEAPTAPEDASAAEREKLGYNAVARLAGADIARFAAVARHLRQAGLSAPEIHAADNRTGFMVLEDLGDGLFVDVVAAGGDEDTLYRNAVDVLAKLHATEAPRALGDKPLFRYDETALLAETDLLTEWYFPHALGRAATAEEIAEHRSLWRAALAPVLASPRSFVHRDYHAQNLLWLPERAGAARTGLIDFQDAVAGSRAYDLVSLLEDARRDVDPAVAAAATEHYLRAMAAQGTPLDREAFRAEMAAMAAQRNAKIVGIFARLFRRDGKPRYLALLPRVWAHLTRDLSHPSQAPLRAWYDRAIPHDTRFSGKDAQ